MPLLQRDCSDRHRRVGGQVEPARRRRRRRPGAHPSAATIAPLSVHSFGRGTRSGDAAPVAPLLGQRPQPGVRRHPAADHQRLDAAAPGRRRPPWRSARRRPPPGSSPRRRPTGTGSPARSRASTQRATAVFSPEKEKSNRCAARSLRRGQAAREGDRRGVAVAGRPVDRRARRERAGRAAGPPCRTPRRPRRRWSRRAG